MGHAYCALMNARMAQAVNGRLLLRLEDLDAGRCRREFAQGVSEDLAWLGLAFAEPPRRQSEHLADFAPALARLDAMGLTFACACTRGEIAQRHRGARDPDGSPLHLGRCRVPQAGQPVAIRLDMAQAVARVGRRLQWQEFGEGGACAPIIAEPAAWGDVALRAKAGAPAYHLAVVVDDANQGVTDVMRGRDLFAATAVHRLLQALLGLPPPRYRHHRLVLDAGGVKMSKSASSTPLSALRAQGYGASDLRAALGFGGVCAKPLAVALS